MAALAVYLDGGGSLSVNSTNIVLTLGAQTYIFPYVGRTLLEVAADVSSSAAYTHCNALTDAGVLSSSALLIEDNDTTSDGGTIIRIDGVTVRYEEETRLRALLPYPETRLLPWYPLIDTGTVVLEKDGVRYTFSVPEYDGQAWSMLFGAPIIDRKSVPATVVDASTIQISRTPLYWNGGNLGVGVNGGKPSGALVADADIHNGLVRLRRKIEKRDQVVVDYSYIETRFIYKDLNLNPSPQQNPMIVDQTALLYLVPSSSSLGLSRSDVVRHTVAKTLAGALSAIPRETEPVLILGAFQVRPSGVLNDVSVTDTRVRGGGIRETKYDDALKRNREAYSVADAGRWDGVPFPAAAAGVLRLPKALLNEYDREYIEQVSRRHLAAGGNLILDFVD
jgi:hypothetical protein